MKKDIAERWADALESGEFTKCRGNLKMTNAEGVLPREEHCVYGVLCELAAREGVVTARQGYDRRYWSFDHAETSIPAAVQQWAGLKSSAPSITLLDRHHYNHDYWMSDLNDGNYNGGDEPAEFSTEASDDRGWELKSFADFIREQWATI